MKKEIKKKSILARVLTSSLTVNIAIMVALGVILLAATLFSLDRYTRHNESVVVPDVKSLSVEDAAKLLSNADLKHEVTDSVYLVNGTPGTIIEQIPYPKANVKTGRTVFLTVQAKMAQMVAVPNLKDFSQRQALAQLNSLGFTSVNIRQVPSQYVDLVVYVEHKGDTVLPGQKLPKGASLSLVVGAGGVEAPMDSMDVTEGANIIDESFFQ